MILRCNYEELRALRAGATAVLGTDGAPRCALALLPESLAGIEALLPRLDGDLEVVTLDEQRRVLGAVATIVECLEAEMKSAVVTTHPGHEGAVDAYFDFAHALNVLSRLREMGQEMVAVIELVTGGPPTEDSSRGFRFPD